MALVQWGVQDCSMCGYLLDDDLNCPECEICNGENMEEKFDAVNNPPHYTIRGGIECIDYIKQVLGSDGFAYWCWGNVIKYQHRHEYKGKPVQDMEKAQFYLDKWIETRKESKK